MAIQIVMDHHGDSRHQFDAKNSLALLEAEKRFRTLTGNGYTAAVRDAAGTTTLVRHFDPSAEETLFYPRLVGG